MFKKLLSWPFENFAGVFVWLMVIYMALNICGLAAIRLHIINVDPRLIHHIPLDPGERDF